MFALAWCFGLLFSRSISTQIENLLSYFFSSFFLKLGAGGIFCV
jgi:hypothetical protein